MQRRFGSFMFALFLFLSITCLAGEDFSGHKQSGRIVRVGVYENPPLISSRENDDAEGLFADIIREIARREGWSITFVKADWASCLDMLANAEIDIMPAIAVTDERLVKYHFNNVDVFTNWGQLYVSPDSEIQGLLDLSNKRVGIIEEDVYYAGSNGIKNSCEEFGIKCNFVKCVDYEDIFKKISSGDVEAGAVARFFGEINCSGHNVKPTPTIFNPIRLRYAFPKNSGYSPDLIKAVDYHLDRMKDEADSPYNLFMATRLGDDATGVPGWAKEIFISMAALLILLVTVALFLRRKVASKTDELKKANDELEQRVSERTKELENIQDLFNKAQISSSMGTWRMDLETGELFWSDGVYPIFGREKTGKTNMRDDFFELVHPDDREMMIAIGDNPFNVDHRVIMPDGTVRWVNEQADVITTEDGRNWMVGTCQDITKRKQLEEQLIRSERLAAVGTLAGGIAHEFNNINVAVMGFTQLALMNSDLNQDVRECLERIKKSTLRARGVTANLLAFSGQKRGQRVPDSLSRVTGESIVLVEREFSTRGVVIEKKFADMPKTYMDSDAIGQVILNLLINAEHAMCDCDEKKLTIETGEKDGRVFVSVSDTGCGIPSDKLSSIFSPFFSTKGEYAPVDSPQAKIKGTGLGLSVSHTIVSNHQGEIKVESDLGKGTTFTVTLPVLSLPVEDHGVVYPKTVVQCEPSRIMVLDDENDIRALLRHCLTNSGHVVDTTSSGKEALEMMTKNRFDLIILDIQMPLMDGVKFMREVRGGTDFGDPALLVITGKTTPLSRSECHDLDIGGILYKPFDLDALQDAVNVALAGRTPA